MQLIVKNGQVLQSNGTFKKGHIGIDEGKIAALWYDEEPPADKSIPNINAEGLLVSPGLIDTHTHGGNTCSFCFSTFNSPGEQSSWEKMQRRLSSIGVTSILATGTSLPPEETLNFVDSAAALSLKNKVNQVEVLGIYMEGPYISKARKGAHREEYIRNASKDEVRKILERAGGLIKVWALAPEIRENLDLAENLAASGISVSIAHSDASYDEALAAFHKGVNRVTHTFNGMPPISHRYEGIITAAMQQGAFMELIADGHHVSPMIVRMFISASDPGKIVLVSDNNEFAGLPDGNYDQGKSKLTVAQGQIKTEAGGLAGSIACLNKCVHNLTHWGFSAADALKMATENPARSIGVFNRKGSISMEKDADIVIWNSQFEAMMTIKAGRIVHKHETYTA